MFVIQAHCTLVSTNTCNSKSVHSRARTHTHTLTRKKPHIQTSARVRSFSLDYSEARLLASSTICIEYFFFFNGSLALIATCHHGNNHPWRAIWLRRWRKCSHSLKRDLTRWMAQTMERCGCLTVACRYQDLLPVTTLSPRRVQFLTALCTSVSNTIWQYLDEYSPSIFETHACDDCRPQKGR